MGRLPLYFALFVSSSWHDARRHGGIAGRLRRIALNARLAFVLWRLDPDDFELRQLVTRANYLAALPDRER